MRYVGQDSETGADLYEGDDGRLYRRKPLPAGAWWRFVLVFAAATSPLWLILPLVLYFNGAFN